MRNFQAKDIVLFRDSNQVGVAWRLVDVTEIFPGAHGLLWRVELGSKNFTTVKASRPILWEISYGNETISSTSCNGTSSG